MTLAQYMEITKTTDQQLAEILGLERSMVTKMRLGSRRPGWDQAAKIKKWSKGAVGLETWVNGK